ncbi:rho GTPase-activating protein 17a isoform X4 [Oncorhynchus tshawytscha]|uniref:rho GTPase-activating protein 17a isoform X4 n=1 Tax=Oncorhynchus tshawytscha TaxID=74940 RepID=UPI001C3D8DAA|nr:rho GTPase-activating protein 17a isoform X4 [Oncorhynchus tshawytscha]
MKKQFNRMKQLANQTVGRAEKTEVLSDDLLQIERRMEMVRVVSHNTHKRMVTCLQGHIGTDAEKRHKKLPLTALSQAMVDGGSQLGEESLIGKMMEVCGEAENRLASELLQHEVQIEKDVLDPLNQLAEVDIPNILKQRKQLARLVLDYDSARARWLQATKSIISGTNTQALTAKADLLKEEVDEAMNKMELCKDQLAADMYSFFSKEGDYARYYVMLLEAQADYHRKSLTVLESVLPTIQAQQDSWTEKPAFGTGLEEHLKRSSREIALPLEACVMMLLETGMKEEGLFRIAAGASKLKKLKAALDCSTSQLEEFYSDPHAVAGALKSYLRELPEPLMSFQLYDEWIQASNVSEPDKRLQALWVVCDQLPKNNKANLRYLVKFLSKLAQDSEVNKMTPSNIAIVLGPNMLWAKTEGTLAEMAAATSVHVVTIIEPIIQHADWFFPEDVEFNVSGMFAMPTPPSNHSMEYDCSTIERKRPGSMVGPENDNPRKDSFANKLSDHNTVPRRGSNTLGRKQHASPAFQPPLPPVEAPGPGQFTGCVAELQAPPGGMALEGCQPSLALSMAALVAAQQLLATTAEELSNPKREPSSTPTLHQRNGSGGGHPGTASSAGGGGAGGQLGVGGPGAGSMGPSPHMMRRGTKKPAPAPPKPLNPPSGQSSNPTNHHPFSGQGQSLSPSPRPLSSSSHSPTSPISQPLPPPAANPATSPHPGPQPPAPTAPTPSQVSPPLHPRALSQPAGDYPGRTSLLQTPPPRLTPLHPPPPSWTYPVPILAPLSLPVRLPPRPRPVPKPRNRPNIPPPPQPPTQGNDTNGICSTAYKIMGSGAFMKGLSDPALSLKGLTRAFIPEFAVDQQPVTAPSMTSVPQPKDSDLDTESTVL